MPGMRLLLLLLIFGGLALFALQNWSPFLPLVVLGIRTLELPLAVWMLGAIAAGALTTLVIAVLFSISNSFAVSSRRRARPLQRGEGEPFTANSRDSSWQSSANDRAWTSGWASAKEPQPADRSPYRPSSNSAADSDDDWENPRRLSDDWEDWGTPSQPSQPPYQTSTYQQSGQQSGEPRPFYSNAYPRPEDDLPNIATPERDREDEEWADWDGYEDVPHPVDRSSRDLDDFDDFEDLDGAAPTPPRDRPPQRRAYEVRQEPEIRYQSGTIYSYGYRKSDNAEEDEPEASYDEEPGVGSPAPVYDAEYRVLTPPILSEDDLPPTNSSTTLQTGEDDDDWGFDDSELEEFEEDDDEPPLR